MPWQLLLLWVAAIGFAGVVLVAAHLALDVDDDHESIDGHRRQMNALAPGGRTT